MTFTARSAPPPPRRFQPMNARRWGGENVYAISKADQERLLISWGRSTGTPVVALRYSCTYGPRQSVFNPYTGVDRDLLHPLDERSRSGDLRGRPSVARFDLVEDVARANMIVATDDRADGRVFNVGTGPGG